MPTLKMTVDATAEPVTLEELKLFMGLSTVSTVEDAMLNAMEKAARYYCENYTGKPCLPETFQYICSAFPDSEFILPRGPLSTSTADVTITYLDASSGDSTTLGSSVYGIDINAEPPRIFLNDGYDWPDHYTQRNAITVQFVAGVTVTTAAPATDCCPPDIELWIKMRVKSMYDARDAIQSNYNNVLPHPFFDGLLDRHCIIDLRP